MNCIKCDGKVTKFGKINKEQRYRCGDCNITFTDTSLIKIKERKLKYEKIIDMYTISGMSTTEIGKVLGTSSTVPQRILKGMGITRTISEAKKGKLRGTSLPTDKIIRLYCEGTPTTKIAKDLGYSKTSVLKVLMSNNIPRDNEYEYHHPYDDAIKWLYIEGSSMLEVSKLLKIPYTTINTRLHKFGLVRTEDKFKIGMDYDTYLENLPAYDKYRNDVNKVTNEQPIEILDNCDKRGLCGVDGAYQLDHKFSILEGFKQGVEPEVIGNITNLGFIPWEDNLNKGSDCSITLEELRVKTN